MGSKGYCVLLIFLATCSYNFVYALSYQLSDADRLFLHPYEQRIDELNSTLSRDKRVLIVAKLQEAKKGFPTSSREALILESLATYTLSGLSVQEDTTPPIPQTFFTDEELSGMQSFVATRQPLVTSSMDFAQSCKDHYAAIDALARTQNFPTALIIATRWREYSCTMQNPANGRGIFQITSHHYEPGYLSEAGLLEQVQHFIDFARAKRKYHDNVQPFDDTGAITLSYLHYDLLSIQKHSIMYNGVKSDVTPENSVYANQNFGMPAEGRDGIVAMVIKVLAWWLVEQKKE